MDAKVPAISRLTKPWRRLQVCTFRRAVEVSTVCPRALIHAVACAARALGSRMLPSVGAESPKDKQAPRRWAKLIPRCSVRERDLFGFPRPRDPYWNDETFAGVAEGTPVSTSSPTGRRSRPQPGDRKARPGAYRCQSPRRRRRGTEPLHRRPRGPRPGTVRPRTADRPAQGFAEFRVHRGAPNESIL
jgi:hypothetical protein